MDVVRSPPVGWSVSVEIPLTRACVPGAERRGILEAGAERPCEIRTDVLDVFEAAANRLPASSAEPVSVGAGELVSARQEEDSWLQPNSLRHEETPLKIDV